MVVCLVALALLGFAPRVARAEGPASDEFLRVGKLTFEGNEHFTERELRKWIRTQTPTLFHPFRRSIYRRDFIRGDVEFLTAFYKRHGYLDVSVDDRSTVDPVNRRVDVAFIINEGRVTYVDSVSYLGVTQIPMDQVRRNTLLPLHQPFNPFAVEAERDRVLQLFADQAFYPRSSDSWDSTAGLARVRFLFEESPAVHVREITFQGLANNRPYILRREMKLKPGSLLKRKDVEEDKARLYDTDLFQQVQTSADSVAGRGDSVVDLVVSFSERKPWWLEAGTGYGSHDAIRLSGQLGTRSLFWQGKRFTMTSLVDYGRNDSVDANAFEAQTGTHELTYEEPWFFASRTRAQVKLYYWTQAIPRLPKISRGVTVTFRRDMSLISRVSLSFDHRGVNSHAADTVAPPSYISRRLDLTAYRDGRDNAFDPHTGTYQDVALEVAGGLLGGSSKFHKEVANLNLYRPFMGRPVLASRLRLGFLTPLVTPVADTLGLQLVRTEDRFRTGGATTVRGYAFDEIGGLEENRGPRSGDAYFGGRVMIVANAEMRFPLWGLLAGAVFLDAGNVWRSPSDVSLRSFMPRGFSGLGTYNNMRYSMGAGIRFNTPVGPFRIDYAYKLNPPVPLPETLTDKNGVSSVVENARPRTAWHLSLGQAF